MSEAFVNDVAVESLLGEFGIRRTSATLKGFDEPVTICQFKS